MEDAASCSSANWGPPDASEHNRCETDFTLLYIGPEPGRRAIGRALVTAVTPRRTHLKKARFSHFGDTRFLPFQILGGDTPTLTRSSQAHGPLMICISPHDDGAAIPQNSSAREVKFLAGR